jgi:hypothetical protein
MVDGDGVAHATYHSQPDCTLSPHNLHDGLSTTVGTFSSEWHEYAVQFSGSEAMFFVDSKLILNVPKCAAPMTNKTHCGQFFDVGYHLVLNTAIGGGWPKPPDKHTTFPGYHSVDFVHVVQQYKQQQQQQQQQQPFKHASWSVPSIQKEQ